MDTPWAIGPGIPGEPETDNRRRAGRLTCFMLDSSLGEVLDLSVTGMRCRSSRSPGVEAGQLMAVELKSLAGVVVVQGRVVWSTKKSWRRFEVGLQFVNVTDDLRRTLVEIARISTDRQCIKRSA